MFLLLWFSLGSPTWREILFYGFRRILEVVFIVLNQFKGRFGFGSLLFGWFFFFLLSFLKFLFDCLVILLYLQRTLMLRFLVLTILGGSIGPFSIAAFGRCSVLIKGLYTFEVRHVVAFVDDSGVFFLRLERYIGESLV